METTVDLHYSDGIAAARTTLALAANPVALQRRLPDGWELAPTAARTCAAPRGAAAACWSPSTRSTPPGPSTASRRPGWPSSATSPSSPRPATRPPAPSGHLHWFTYTEDPAGVPGKYGDGRLADITRSQTFTKEQRGQTQVRESFSAVAADHHAR
jgi:hypothetical protein